MLTYLAYISCIVAKQPLILIKRSVHANYYRNISAVKWHLKDLTLSELSAI